MHGPKKIIFQLNYQNFNNSKKLNFNATKNKNVTNDEY